MKMFNYIIISGLLLSCGNAEQKKTESFIDAAKNDTAVVSRDTTISHDIDGISAEGAEAVTKYINGQIKESTISIYGETGQAKIIYTFLPNQINVTERDFAYKGDLTSVTSEKDMKVKKEITYTIDLNGNPIGNADKDRVDIFQEFKKAVPFELK